MSLTAQQSRAWTDFGVNRHGDTGRPGATLAHDSWNEHETLFPPESYISLVQLREVVAEWAYGALVPPSVVQWTAVSDVTWF